jgi:uncharacterized protein (TIGR02186 family)
MRRLIAAIAALFIAGVPAAAEHLIIALSTSNIRIDSDFTGGAITVFGVIERDAATVSRVSTYDLAVVVRGPSEPVVARRKEPLLFLWMNRASMTFASAPTFYAVSSTRPLDEMATSTALHRFGIGFDSIELKTLESGDAATAAEFRDAFIRLRKEDGLYSEFAGGVDFIGASESVFRSAAWIPSNAPDGRYIVEVYLFSGSVFLAREQAVLNVTKVGFEQFMYVSSHEHALLYGLACVLLALFTGWLAGVVFRRD